MHCKNMDACKQILEQRRSYFMSELAFQFGKNAFMILADAGTERARPIQKRVLKTPPAATHKSMHSDVKTNNELFS